MKNATKNENHISVFQPVCFHHKNHVQVVPASVFTMQFLLHYWFASVELSCSYLFSCCIIHIFVIITSSYNSCIISTSGISVRLKFVETENKKIINLNSIPPLYYSIIHSLKIMILINISWFLQRGYFYYCSIISITHEQYSHRYNFVFSLSHST